jgi:hypothetical protein
MRAPAFAVFVALLLSLSHAYQIEQTRDELLSDYYSYVDAKIPKSARLLIGDEKINVYMGQSVLGIETKKGELYSFEYAPVKSPNIAIIVSDLAAERIGNRSEGVLDAIDNGGIQIRTYSWFSAFKMAALRSVYSLSGIDKRLTDKNVKEGDIYSANSLFLFSQRVLVRN